MSAREKKAGKGHGVSQHLPLDGSLKAWPRRKHLSKDLGEEVSELCGVVLKSHSSEREQRV